LIKTIPNNIYEYFKKGELFVLSIYCNKQTYFQHNIVKRVSFITYYYLVVTFSVLLIQINGKQMACSIFHYEPVHQLE